MSAVFVPFFDLLFASLFCVIIITVRWKYWQIARGRVDIVVNIYSNKNNAIIDFGEFGRCTVGDSGKL